MKSPWLSMTCSCWCRVTMCHWHSGRKIQIACLHWQCKAGSLPRTPKLPPKTNCGTWKWTPGKGEIPFENHHFLIPCWFSAIFRKKSTPANSKLQRICPVDMGFQQCPPIQPSKADLYHPANEPAGFSPRNMPIAPRLNDGKSTVKPLLSSQKKMQTSPEWI